MFFLILYRKESRCFTDSLCYITVVSDKQPERLTSWINKGVSILAAPFKNMKFAENSLIIFWQSHRCAQKVDYTSRYNKSNI